jgi:hypothetical protein
MKTIENAATFTITDNIEQTKRDYECAAWWDTRRSDIGSFPMTLTSNHNKAPVLVVQLPATIIASDFRSYFGGVAIGGGDNNRNGERTTITIALPVAQAVKDMRISGITREVLMIAGEHHLGRAKQWTTTIAEANTAKECSPLGTVESDDHPQLTETSMLGAYGGWLLEDMEALETVREALRKFRTPQEHADAVVRGNAAQRFSSPLSLTLRSYSYSAGLRTVDQIKAVEVLLPSK